MKVDLSNGIKIPSLAMGTWGLQEGEEVIRAVKNAISAGYRHIDTADAYKNEKGVGIAIQETLKSGVVKRSDLFVTTKVPDWRQGYDNTLKCFQESLNKLGLNYVDLYLIHSPYRRSSDWKRSVLDTWRALEKLYREGKIKAIGVSNFSEHHLEYLLSEAEIKPMINQIEIHPQHQQRKLVKYCQDHGIAVSAWGALNQGRIFKIELLNEIASKYKKTVSQLAVKWSLQKNFIPIVKSSKEERIRGNFDVFDFEISEQDMAYIDTLDGGEFSGWHTDAVYPEQTVPLSSLPDMFQDKPYIWKWKLFNLIPFIKVKKIKNKMKVYLFGFILLLKGVKK